MASDTRIPEPVDPREVMERFARSSLTAATFAKAELEITWDSGEGPVTSAVILVTSKDFEDCARVLRRIGR